MFDLANADVTFNGIAGADFAGFSISNAGDINGDGLGDLLIGAPNEAGLPGQAFLVYGQNGALGLSGTISLADIGTTVPGAIFNGINPNDTAGFSVSNAGDINGDGIGDLLISAAHADPSGVTDAGQTYLVYGQAAIPEPGTIALMALGLAGLARKVHRRNAR